MKIRIGVLGCAKIAIKTLIPELHRHENFELVAIASRTPEKASLLAEQYGCQVLDYEALIAHPEIDAIYLPLPTGLHAEWILRCLENNKHVLSEKSLGSSLVEVEAMIELARKSKLLVMENFQFRFHSQHQFVKKIIEDGVLGKVRCIRAAFGFPPFPDGDANIRYHKSLGGGALLDAGAYMVKVTTFLLGFDVTVGAATLDYVPECDVDIGGTIYLKSASGIVSETAFGFDHFYQCNYEIWGSKGKLIAKRAYTAPPDLSPEILIESAAGTEVRLLPPDNHFRNMLTHFATLISSGGYEAEYLENLVQARLLEQAKMLSEFCR